MQEKKFNPKWIKIIRWALIGKSTELKKNTDEYEKDIQNKIKDFSQNCISNFPNLSKPQIESASINFGKALRYKKKKELIKEVITSLFSSIVLILFLVMPTLPVLVTEKSWHYALKVWIPYFILLTISILIISSISDFTRIVLDKFSRTIKIVLSFIFWVFLCYISYVHFKRSDYLSILIFSIATSINLLQTVIYLNNLVIEPLIDLLMYKEKVVNIQHLVLESAFSLCNNNISVNDLNNNKYRNNIIDHLEKLASMIENEWQSEISSFDAKTHKWKQKTFQAIANSIRKKKRLIIIPSTNNLLELKLHLNSYLINIINNDWQNFINEDFPSERVKIKSFVQVIKSTLIAFLPISSYLTIEYFCPNAIPDHFKQITLLFSIIWLAMNILLWLDPNLLDKLSAAKTAKSLFDKSDSE